MKVADNNSLRFFAISAVECPSLHSSLAIRCTSGHAHASALRAFRSYRSAERAQRSALAPDSAED